MLSFHVHVCVFVSSTLSWGASKQKEGSFDSGEFIVKLFMLRKRKWWKLRRAANHCHSLLSLFPSFHLSPGKAVTYTYKCWNELFFYASKWRHPPNVSKHGSEVQKWARWQLKWTSLSLLSSQRERVRVDILKRVQCDKTQTSVLCNLCKCGDCPERGMRWFKCSR